MTTFHPDQFGLRDNHTRGTVADFLHEKIRDGSKLSIVSAYFTIYACDALKSVLDRIEHLDFLFGEPSFVNRLDPNKTEKKAFLIDADGLQLANQLQQKRVAKECAAWIADKVDKTVRQSNLLHGKMYHVASGGVDDAILGSSNFTVHGLGLGETGNNIELNLIPDMIAAGLMGYTFVCPDLIGGGEFTSFLDQATIDQDLIVRSAQVHALAPMMQFSVAPWRVLDTAHLAAVQQAVALRRRFTPRILELAQTSAATGEPILRPQAYVFPDGGYEHVKDQS